MNNRDISDQFKVGFNFKTLLEEAISEKHVGETETYNLVLKFISQEYTDEMTLKSFIEAARSCINLLKTEHETLVGAVLKMNWTSKGDDFVDSYLDFLAELVSAHTFYLRGCLKMLLQKFLPAIKITDSIENIDVRSFDGQFDNAHKGIFAITKIVPTAPRHLLIKLGDFFPYVGKHQLLIQLYMKNMFQITKYMPSLQEKVLEIIIDNLLSIDVHICKVDLDDEMLSDTDDEIDDVQFNVEIENEDTLKIDEKKRDVGEMTNEKARKLDNLMLALFEHIQKTCFNQGLIDWEKSEKLFADLLRVFEMVLLPTHASACVQFVVFYACSFDQFFANSFLQFCWQKVCNPNIPVIHRQSASAYIGSFVARAKFISTDIIKTCLLLFSDWIHSYLNVLDICLHPDLSKHAAFYSVCQTLFYVFVFCFKCIEEEDDWRTFVKKLNLDRIVTSRLNPLKFCARTIVDMFARVTRKYEIVFCYTIIEHNCRSLLSSAVTSNVRDQKNMLDSFFPFDPYLLRKSSCFVTPIYQDWTGIEGDDLDGEKDGNGNREMAEEEKLDDSKIQYSLSPRTPKFDLCISPGFHPEFKTKQTIYEE